VVNGDYRLSIVLPAYNEEDNILTAIKRSTEVAERLCVDHEVIVVDDGSRDRTADLVREAADADLRVRLVRHGKNRGYGEALRTGFLSARMELVFFTDADNQFDLDELEAFLPWTERVDVVAGYRIDRQDHFIRKLYAFLWNRAMRVLFYVPVRDIDCAFKVFRRSLLERLDIESGGAMVNTELMVKLGRSGAAVVEIGVTHYPRTAGQARGASPKVIFRAGRELAGMYWRLSRSSAGRASEARAQLQSQPRD
jgi:glycosyltransferase involved in cell wall biosynthesis